MSKQLFEKGKESFYTNTINMLKSFYDNITNLESDIINYEMEMESIQKRALRIIHPDSTYIEALKKQSWKHCTIEEKSCV
jgi:GTP1/Obg family GTP-binding protein